MNLNDLLKLPSAKLKRILALRRDIERLETQLGKVAIAVVPAPLQKTARRRRTMSASARKKISLAAKARWARIRAAKSK